jgi:hypothetical protein
MSSHLLYQDIFDSRDVMDRLDELQAMDADDLDEDERDELQTLLAIEAEAGNEPDWKYGMTFIADGYWETYAEETAFDVGFVERNSTIARYIDWERWSNDLAVDYTVYDFEGYAFYAR